MTQYDNLKQSILLVEDDEELASLIKEYLEAAEMRVDIQPEGITAVERIVSTQPDLVILDLMLPGKDGISICREARLQYQRPILILTASAESVDHIIGLEVGADDFMQKPVEPRILLAHVRALLRRSTPPTQTTPPITSVSAQTTEAIQDKNSTHNLTFGKVTINTHTRQVKLADQILDLTTPEYDILVLLARQQGQIFSRDDIFRTLRGIEYDGQNRLVDITICQVRAKLSVDGNSHRHIRTIRNKGYVCVSEVD